MINFEDQDELEAAEAGARGISAKFVRVKIFDLIYISDLQIIR